MGLCLRRLVLQYPWRGGRVQPESVATFARNTHYQGDEVELTLINKLDDPHGFAIKAFGIEQVVQPKSQMTVKFTAAQAGAYPYICQLHPPHLGGNILVLSK